MGPRYLQAVDEEPIEVLRRHLRRGDEEAEPADLLAAGRGKTLGQRYRLPGWSELTEVLFQAKYGQPTKRKAGRPRGPHLIQSRAEIVEAYQGLWAKNDRRPSWAQVAGVLDVDERTLRRARRKYGMTGHLLEKRQ